MAILLRCLAQRVWSRAVVRFIQSYEGELECEFWGTDEFACPYCCHPVGNLPSNKGKPYICPRCNLSFWARCIVGPALVTSTDDPAKRRPPE